MKVSVNAGGIHSLNLKKKRLSQTWHCFLHLYIALSIPTQLTLAWRRVALATNNLWRAAMQDTCWGLVGMSPHCQVGEAAYHWYSLAQKVTCLDWTHTVQHILVLACLLVACTFIRTYVHMYAHITHVHVYWCVHCVRVWGEECDIHTQNVLLCNPPYDSLLPVTHTGYVVTHK